MGRTKKLGCVLALALPLGTGGCLTDSGTQLAVAAVQVGVPLAVHIIEETTPIVKRQWERAFGNDDARIVLASVAPQSNRTPWANIKPGDIDPPEILIAEHMSTASDSLQVEGRVSDNSDIASLSVAGRRAEVHSDGSFGVTRYVPAMGETITIAAIDEWGNRSEKQVRLQRQDTATATELTFAALDPTGIGAVKNADAVALIIGIGDYRRTVTAKYADRDAQIFQDYAHRALGIPKANIKLLIGGSADLSEIKITLKRWLPAHVAKGRSDVVVFFAGHGLAAPEAERLYLLPYDADPGLLADTALARDDLLAMLAALKPRSVTLFLDTCYSGLTRTQQFLVDGTRGLRVLANQPQPSGPITVFSAAAADQVAGALDEASHGLFSYFVMQGLGGQADSNNDRVVTAGELHDFVHTNTARTAAQQGRAQTSQFSGDAQRVLVRLKGRSS